MVSVRVVACASVAALIATGASAAELAPAPIREFAAGWYLRGDIGFSNQEVRRVNYIPGPGETAIDSQQTASAGFDTAGIFGIGVGYQINSWLRIDVTGEYRGKANYRGHKIISSGGETYAEQDFGSKSEWVVLSNGYVDLGTWWSMTPFLGVGAGAAYNIISNFQDMVLASTGGPVLANNFYGTGTKWNFAWAFHAGVGYHVTPALTIELAYRYLSLGDALTGSARSNDSAGATGRQEFKDITSHDLTAGVRWLL
jgi:opacity protein-like surface antigen